MNSKADRRLRSRPNLARQQTPTPAAAAADGIRWSASWPSRSPRCWPASTPMRWLGCSGSGWPPGSHHRPQRRPGWAGHSGRWPSTARPCAAVAPGLRFPTPPRRCTSPPSPVAAYQTMAQGDGVWLTSLTHTQASPARLADLVRGHRGIEALHPHPRRHLRRGRLSGPHWQRSQGHGDRAQRRRRAPWVMQPGHIAAALRRNARDATRPLILLGITFP